LPVFLLDLGAQGHHVAVQRHVDLVLAHAGHLGLDGVAFVGLLHVDLDLGRRRQRVAV
jgi:hypothetical protein